jgi:RNA polymerase sigma-70 factor (ECF subfamily)
MKYTDSQLISRLGKGDVKAFNEIFDACWEPVFIICLKYTLVREDAEELAQNVFQAFWERRTQLSADTMISHYLCKAAKNRSFNYLRDKSRREKREALLYQPEELLIDQHTPRTKNTNAGTGTGKT